MLRVIVALAALSLLTVECMGIAMSGRPSEGLDQPTSTPSAATVEVRARQTEDASNCFSLFNNMISEQAVYPGPYDPNFLVGITYSCDEIETWTRAAAATGVISRTMSGDWDDPVEVLLTICIAEKGRVTQTKVCKKVFDLYPDGVYHTPFADFLRQTPPPSEAAIREEQLRTLARYNRLKKQMTYLEVVEILGKPEVPRRVGHTAGSYRWKGAYDNWRIDAFFFNDKLDAWHQQGLE